MTFDINHKRIRKIFVNKINKSTLLILKYDDVLFSLSFLLLFENF